MFSYEVLRGILLPFFGTAAGALCVLFRRKTVNAAAERVLNGFSGGVMTAASVFSLLIPAMEQSTSLGRLRFLPASVGLLLGMLLILLFERTADRAQTGGAAQRRTALLVFAVVLHNIPEGMATGAVYAARLFGDGTVTAAAALALSAGIAIQNIPEGAIVSMPVYAKNGRRGKAVLAGLLSGAVEPVSSALTILLSSAVVPILPYFLGFAAGAMLYVTAAELIPSLGDDRRGTVFFMLGFVLMMLLDVATGA